MPLPILKMPQIDLVRLFHRTQLHWSQHYGDSTTLDVGQAIGNASLADVPGANILLDASLPASVTPSNAMQILEQHFSSIVCRCRSIVPNPAADPQTTLPLIDHLLDSGFTRQICDILYLKRLRMGNRVALPDVRVIPARASYAHARQLAELAADDALASRQQVEATLLHLDDPHWDAWMALRDGQVVGGAGVLAVGEAGLIENVFVPAAFRRQKIATLLMDRLFDICARAQFRHVLIGCPADHPLARGFFANLGFERVGHCETFQR